MPLPSVRRDLVSRPILSLVEGVIPTLSATEREAIDAGDTWWDAALFTGDPDWANCSPSRRRS
jgi:acyl-CoA dehydrogenase